MQYERQQDSYYSIVLTVLAQTERPHGFPPDSVGYRVLALTACERVNTPVRPGPKLKFDGLTLKRPSEYVSQSALYHLRIPF